MIFEGTTADAVETFFSVADPTSSDKTISFPDASGTVILSGHTFTGNVTATSGRRRDDCFDHHGQCCQWRGHRDG